jgi:hypothetical protein
MKINFEKELNNIRHYAQDSIDYGESSGNKIALRRGHEVMSALRKIEAYVDYMEMVADSAQTIEDLNILLMSDMVKRLDSDPF